MKLILSALKPRNPFVVPCLRRVAGPHRASGGARRQAERLHTRKLLCAERDMPPDRHP